MADDFESDFERMFGRSLGDESKDFLFKGASKRTSGGNDVDSLMEKLEQKISALEAQAAALDSLSEEKETRRLEESKIIEEELAALKREQQSAKSNAPVEFSKIRLVVEGPKKFLPALRKQKSTSVKRIRQPEP